MTSALEMETFGLFRNVSFTKIYGFTLLTISIALTTFVLSKLAHGISNNSANVVLRDEKYKDFSKAFLLSNYLAVLRHTPKRNLI
jgi:purine-nucleoside phosphorylase